MTLVDRPATATVRAVRSDASAERLRTEDLRLLGIIATGAPVTCVAEIAGVSDRTVRRRVRDICEALGVSTAIEAVAWAARRHLI